MAKDIGDPVYDLQMEAWRLPTGEAKVRLYEEALRLAEQGRGVEIKFLARIYLANAAGCAGYEEKTMTALAWCLAAFEEHERELLEHKTDLILLLKNFLCGVSQFPHVSRAQFEDLLGQLESLLRRFGHTPRTAHFVRMCFARQTGDRPTTIASRDKFLSYPRDQLSHQIASEADEELWHYLFLGDTERAIEAGFHIIRNGLSCGNVPHFTYNGVLRPLAEMGRYQEADDFQQKGYRLIRKTRAFLDLIGYQIAYQMHRGQTTSAIRMFERHLLWALETHDMASRYYFYTAAKHLFTSLPQKTPTHKLSLPTSFSLYDESNEYDIAKLIQWLDQETDSLAAAFDQRNGNDYFSVEILKLLRY
ncbi:hypothetical protein [Bremerella sp.]|uniref:hypothetical protein n=1 Tax=Bremerella sp. TaxID=2795602 RepID=UPI00391D7CD8